jgi:hypothetical protein
MDFFQESRWFFEEEDRSTWYNKVVRELIIQPRLARFGILQGVCSDLTGSASSKSDACNHVISLRNSVPYANAFGYSDAYARPIGLFADLGNLEFNDPCRQCYEEEYETTITTLQSIIVPLFQVLAVELGGSAAKQGQNASESLVMYAQATAKLATTITRQDVVDYFSYTVVRQLYAELGAPSYVTNYNAFTATPGLLLVCRFSGLDCPASVSVDEAKGFLLNHADHAYSSSNTAGVPFPFWGEGEGNDSLFQGQNPVGGSGIDLSGNAFSATLYVDLANYLNKTLDPVNWNPLYTDGESADPDNDPAWASLVETDPVFKWFVASVTNVNASKSKRILEQIIVLNSLPPYFDLTA